MQFWTWKIFAMSDFEYSVDALNARNAFLGVDAIVYVEGEDDVPFWHEIFSQVSGLSFEIEPRGCSNELDKYISLIENGDINAIAARDSDYLLLTGKVSSSKKVVYTLGYSIENTLYVSSSVHALTKQWCKAPTLPSSICVDWLRDLSIKIAPLVVQDIANIKAAAGLQVLRDNCSQFMSSMASCVPCPIKVQAKVNEIQPQLPADVLSEIAVAVGDNPEKIIQMIRGHFLASAVARFISKQAHRLDKKISLSRDGLYTAAMTYFSGHFKEGHPHYNHYIHCANAARDALA
jgi:hypothetical protein